MGREKFKLNDNYYVVAKEFKETYPELEKVFYDTMEKQRKKLRIPATDFSELLGYNRTAYPKVIKEERTLGLQMFITFCRLFNYDITSIAECTRSNSVEILNKKVASYFGSLSDETLDAISAVIMESSESEEKKKDVTKLVTKLKATKNERFYLYKKHVPDDIKK